MMDKIIAAHRPWLEPLPKDGDAAGQCPLCGGRAAVQGTRFSRAGLLIRYRGCEECNFRYKTVELLAFGAFVSLRDKSKNAGPTKKEEKHE